MIDIKKLAEFELHPELALKELDQLLDLLESDDETELNSANDLLENCGVPSISVVPFLCDQLKSGRCSRVYWCSTLLGRLGSTVGDELDRVVGEIANHHNRPARLDGVAVATESQLA